MKRFVLAVLLLVSVVAAGLPVHAHPGHVRPRITRFEFTQRPLKSGALEQLVVEAHDPDSWISEIQVQWVDANDSGGVIFAHTYCVQDPEFTTPGTPAKLTLDVTFEHAGAYTVLARAISEKRCEGGNDTRISPEVEQDVVVRPATRRFGDPDDIPGPLDVVRALQSQSADDAGLRTSITHAVRFTDDLGATPLRGRHDSVIWRFDTIGGDGVPERTLTVDADATGTLRAQVRNRSGERLGDARVTADGSRLVVTFGRRLLGRGGDDYAWSVTTRDSASDPCMPEACRDRAPNTGVFVHSL